MCLVKNTVMDSVVSLVMFLIICLSIIFLHSCLPFVGLSSRFLLIYNEFNFIINRQIIWNANMNIILKECMNIIFMHSTYSVTFPPHTPLPGFPNLSLLSRMRQCLHLVLLILSSHAVLLLLAWSLQMPLCPLLSLIILPLASKLFNRRMVCPMPLVQLLHCPHLIPWVLSPLQQCHLALLIVQLSLHRYPALM